MKHHMKLYLKTLKNLAILFAIVVILNIAKNTFTYTYDTLDEKGNKSTLDDYYISTKVEEEDLDTFIESWAKRNKASSQEYEYFRIRSFISRKTTFDHHYIDNGKRPYSAYGAFSDGKSVCMGYALLAKKFFDITNIQNILIHDKVINHLYNRVSLDGFWYDVDITKYDAEQEQIQQDKKGNERIQRILRGEW